MHYSMSSPVAPSSPISEPTVLSGHRTEVDAPLEFPLPYDQCGSYPAYASSQNGFPNFRFHLTEPSVAAEGSSSLLSRSQILPPPTCRPTWENAWDHAFSGNIGPPVSYHVSGPSESRAYGAQQVSEDRAVAPGNQSITPHERECKIRGVFPCTTVSSFTGGQATLANSDPEHVASWYLTRSNAVIVNGPREFVPQTIYQPHSEGDKRRYVSFAKLHPPIIFLSQDSPEWGIPISHLLSNQLIRLVEGNEPAFVSCGPSIGIRVQWSGYQPCHKQVSTKDYTSKRRMISKAKLAQVVARCVKQFMDAMSEQAMQAGSNRQWKVGPFGIRVDDIILVSLHHVSQGSWQPQLRLRRTIATGVGAGPQGHHGS